MEVFDGRTCSSPAIAASSPTHAPQALEMLNGKTANDLADAFAGRLLKEHGPTNSMIDYAWRLATGRKPTLKEQTLAMQYLAAGPQDQKVVKEFALALLNLNAFLYIN
jgi:hypothetical protein